MQTADFKKRYVRTFPISISSSFSIPISKQDINIKRLVLGTNRDEVIITKDNDVFISDITRTDLEDCRHPKEIWDYTINSYNINEFGVLTIEANIKVSMLAMHFK